VALLTRSKSKRAVPHLTLEAVETPHAPTPRGSEKSLFRTVAGLYVDETELTLCLLALTPIGPKQLRVETVPYQTDQLEETLRQLLSPFMTKRGVRIPVAVGVPMLRVIFTSRPLPTDAKDAAPDVLLHDAMRSSNLNVDDMEVDLIKSQPGKRPMASLAACRRKYLAAILSALGNCGVRPVRSEPSPFALMRLAASRYRAPKKSKAAIRIVLGDKQGVAVLSASDQPLSWRTFDLVAGTEAATLISAIKALMIVGRFHGDIPAADCVLIHGRPDLEHCLATEAFQEAVGVPTRYYKDPAFDAGGVALGLAIGCQHSGAAFDLLRALKPPAPLWELIPFGELAAQLVLLVSITLYLHWREQTASVAYAKIHAQAGKHAWVAKMDEKKIEAEKKELGLRLNAVKEYLDTRILWSAYTRDLASHIPESIVLRSLAGQCDLEMGAKRTSKPKTSLVFRLTAPITEGRVMPKEIDSYLEQLRADPLMSRDFPLIEIADLKSTQSLGGHVMADFTVKCLPKTEAPAPKAAPPAHK
jgi:hypothetical protein